MARTNYLLPLLLSLLGSRGLAAEALDPWRGWVVFKQFARMVAEVPDPGVSVQITSADEDTVHLILLRQVLEPEEDELVPVGGVIMEFTFDQAIESKAVCECWSFDSGSFDRFVDLVEGHPLFSDLMAKRPTDSWVYWQDA